MGSEITRRLASIQRIVEIRPIEGADAIEVARVLGWDVVVKKGEFQVGDLAVYFEIDSFLPRREEWKFLEKSSLRKMGEKEGLRLKTIKLRGQISQGLLLPVTSLFERNEEDPTLWEYTINNSVYNEDELVVEFKTQIWDLEEGDDLTEMLGIVKWDPPVPANLAGVVRGNFPSFIRKTDQDRIQNCFGKLKNKWIDHVWEVTVKMDGSSFTSYLNGENFGVCSRNMDLAESEENSFWQIARKYDLENKLKALGRNIAIQGELCGPGIQKNFEQLQEIDMFVFDIFDIDTQSYLSAPDRYEIVQQLGLNHTPIVHQSCEMDTTVTLQQILDSAEGPSLYRQNREGIVFKSLTDPNVSFKAISNSYLLKHEE